VREKLTDRFAATVAPTPGRIERYFDTDKRSPRGFLLRVTSAGARSWALQYREPQSGRQREMTIGDVKSWPFTEARKQGHELRRVVDAGGDPLDRGRAEPIVTELVQRFEDEALPRRAEKTQIEYRAMLRDYLLPALGNRKVSGVVRADIEKLHRRISETGKLRRANAVRSICSILFTQAIVWGLRDDNPAAHIKPNVEHGRERYLSAAEIERLGAVLDHWRPRRPDSVDAITLALLSGARRGEIVGMRWADLDLEAAVWTKPPGLTKQRRAHRVPLSPEAVAVLRRRQAEGTDTNKIVRLWDDHVFAGGGTKTHTNTLERDWSQIRAAAGIEDVRFHDLRHSFASLLVSEGLSLPIIGRMLGHTRPTTTSRYAHLADQPLREAAGIVGKIVGQRAADAPLRAATELVASKVRR
jgi:integrase